MMKKTNRVALSLILLFGGLAWMLALVFVVPSLQMTVIPAVFASALGLIILPDDAFGGIIKDRGGALVLSLFLILGSVAWVVYVGIAGNGNPPLQQTVIPAVLVASVGAYLFPADQRAA